MRTPGAFCKSGKSQQQGLCMEQWPFSIPEVSAGLAGFLQMGKSGAARAEFNAASAYTQRRKQRKSNVAKRLQETRLKCGLKQQDVAERTGINVVTLSGYEIGKNEPNMEALVSLADVYGVTLDYLMCRTDS